MERTNIYVRTCRARTPASSDFGASLMAGLAAAVPYHVGRRTQFSPLIRSWPLAPLKRLPTFVAFLAWPPLTPLAKTFAALLAAICWSSFFRDGRLTRRLLTLQY